MRKFLLLFILALGLEAATSIEDAWQSIEIKNSGLKAAKNDISIAEMKKNAAKSMYLPSVSVTGSYTHLSEKVNLDTSEISAMMAHFSIPFPSTIDLSEQDVFLADLQLLWPLYVGGKIDAAQDIYKAAADEAKALKEMKKDKEFLKLVKYYYGVVVSELLYKTRLKSKEALELHYENAKKLKEQGQIAKIELLNTKVELDAAKVDLLKAKHKLELAHSALNSLVEQNITPSSKLFINFFEKEQEYYEHKTRDDYAGMKIFDAKEKQSKAFISIKEASYKPEIMAFGNYNLYKDKSALMESLPQWFGGVMVKINLVARNDRSEDLEAAKLTKTKIQNLREESLKNLALLVEKTYKEMLAAKDEYILLNSTLALAEENYRLRTISFREGLSTSVELVDAQMNLLGAKTKRLNVAYTYVQKLSQLCVLSGEREIFFEFMGEEIE